MNVECTKTLKAVVRVCKKMQQLADEGDMNRDDVGCGVIFGLLRDSAFKIRALAQSEIEIHQQHEQSPPAEDQVGFIPFPEKNLPLE